MRVEALARRDGWQCWICGGEVDRLVPPTDPTAPTVDHVLPRAHGGSSEPDNLRLAHRRCNGRRGSHLPELTWPDDPPLSAPADLLTSSRRALRRRGSWEVVALAADLTDAAVAAAWLDLALQAVFGESFETRSRSASGGAGPALVELRAVSPTSRTPGDGGAAGGSGVRGRGRRGSDIGARPGSERGSRDETDTRSRRVARGRRG